MEMHNPHKRSTQHMPELKLAQKQQNQNEYFIRYYQTLTKDHQLAPFHSVGYGATNQGGKNHGDGHNQVNVGERGGLASQIPGQYGAS